MKGLNVLLSSLLLGGASLTFAHAEYESSDPAKNAVVDVAPEQVTITYAEPVEARFSIFKVYPLEADVDLSADNAMLRLNGLAAPLISEVLGARGDEEVRVDTGLTTEETSTKTVTLGLRPDLAPGAYVVMWRVLSVDTHTSQGQFVFVVAP